MADTDLSLYNLRYNQITSSLEAFGGGSPSWTVITINNVDPVQVPISRLINTTAPLQGGGNLSVDRTLSITQASSTVNGYLSSTDWNTFNNKQPSGSYITALTGDATASGPGSVPLTLATVNGNVGTFSYASITVNGKGLITSASNGIVGSLTDVGTDGITITGGTGAVIGAGTSIAQHVADTTHNGYLSSTDWNTFNGKQAAGNYITALTGDVTATGPGSAAATLATVNANVGSFTYASITVNGKGLITAASNGTAPVTSVTGTANQINSTGGTTPVLSLSSTLVFPGTATGTLTGHSTLDLALTGGTMSGAIAMGSNKITGLANGTAASDAAAFGQVPVITAGQIVGTATNDNASAGNVGQYIESVGSGNVGTTDQHYDATSISLTAGDWDVTGLIVYRKNTATLSGTIVDLELGISTTSGNSSTGLVLGNNWIDTDSTGIALFDHLPLVVPVYRISLSATTTYYLKGYFGSYSAGNPTAAFRLSARRVR